MDRILILCLFCVLSIVFCFENNVSANPISTNKKETPRFNQDIKVEKQDLNIVKKSEQNVRNFTNIII